MSADKKPIDNFHPSFCSRVIISMKFGHYLSIGSINYNPQGAHSRLIIRYILNTRFSSKENQHVPLLFICLSNTLLL
jgi:hypothetical protein